MAIVLFDARPAIQVVDGTFQTPQAPWAELGNPEVRPLLEKAVTSVGRLESDESQFPFLGTAFAVGLDLAVTAAVPEGSGGLFVSFDEGDRVPVTERIPITFGRVDCLLLKLTLPDGFEPLKLSTLTPDELTDRGAVVIGYPTSDPRNDPAVMQRIFGGILGAKRLMPGRVTGQNEDGALQHDASTLGGSGGAPLIDIATGEVVGIHYAGIYLKTNLAVPATAVAPQVASSQSGHRSPSDLPTRSFDGVLEGRTAVATMTVELPAARPEATPDGRPAPELAPIPSDRPAVSAAGWREALQAEWRNVFTPNQFRVDTAVRAVGAVTDGAALAGWIGTAFLVGDRLALTASFVAQAFATGSGRNVKIQGGHTPGVDFSDALGLDSGTATAPVTGVRFIHPYFHVALLELGPTPAGVTRLELITRLPANLSGRPVALVSYAPSRALVLQPGQALQLGELPANSPVTGEPPLPVLVHDCASSGGSAGGPVVDLGTGYVIGLHSHARKGEEARGGFAQPPWELARDPVLWDGSLAFRPDPKPPWLDRWGVTGAAPAVVSPPGPEPQHWTVDRVPIDWALEEPKKLQLLLVASIDADIALMEAENVGLRPGSVNAGVAAVLLWRELLETLAVAGLLRRFVQSIADQPQYDGIEPQLRTYL